MGRAGLGPPNSTVKYFCSEVSTCAFLVALSNWSRVTKIMAPRQPPPPPPIIIDFGDFWPTSEPLSAVLATNVLPWTHSTILVQYVWIVCYKRKNDFLRSFLQFLAKIVIDVCTSVSFFSATKLSKWRNWIYAILNFTIVQSCIYIFQFIMQI